MINNSKIKSKMKVNIKSLVKPLVLIVVMMLIVLFFKILFGSENIITGVSTSLMVLILFQKDLSKHLIKNSTKIILTNLIIGITAFITCEIPISSLLIVFVIIFLICILTQDLSKKIYLPFAYEFIFLLSSPTSLSGLGVRLVSLIIGSLIVIGINLFIYKIIIAKKRKNREIVNKENNIDKIANKESINLKVSTIQTIKEKIKSKFRKNKKHYLFAIELGIILGIFEFINLYLKIPNAKWLCVLGIGLIWPNIDLNLKSFKKVKGCILGIIIFFLLDLLFFNPDLANIKYLMIFIPNLKNIVLVTIAIISAYIYIHYTLESEKRTLRYTASTLIALSYAYLTIPLSELLIDRFLIILLGSAFCLCFNYLIRHDSNIDV